MEKDSDQQEEPVRTAGDAAGSSVSDQLVDNAVPYDTSPPPYGEINPAMDVHEFGVPGSLPLPQHDFMTQVPGIPAAVGQQTIILVNSTDQPLVTGVIEPVPEMNFVLHFILSCFVTWLCSLACGLAAFLLALSAWKTAKNGDRERARKLGKASLIVSLVGFVVGIVFLIVFIVLSTKKH